MDACNLISNTVLLRTREFQEAQFKKYKNIEFSRSEWTIVLHSTCSGKAKSNCQWKPWPLSLWEYQMLSRSLQLITWTMSSNNSYGYPVQKTVDETLWPRLVYKFSFFVINSVWIESNGIFLNFIEYVLPLASNCFWPNTQIIFQFFQILTISKRLYSLCYVKFKEVKWTPYMYR